MGVRHYAYESCSLDNPKLPELCHKSLDLLDYWLEHWGPRVGSVWPGRSSVWPGRNRL
jgi:hypothetical protein